MIFVGWPAKDKDGSEYVALFNIGDIPLTIEVALSDLGLRGVAFVRDIWARRDIGDALNINFEPIGKISGKQKRLPCF
ncbi:hypothetical protein [Paenibacillus alginolyticus]|uniref:hypothetical protein n=1 Tax=Paenibacillus alginolyticus TaxID=59839 RepID=UPI001565D4E4|nr:hypothetical protein [Paenibacillus frigoriresistens]